MRTTSHLCMFGLLLALVCLAACGGGGGGDAPPGVTTTLPGDTVGTDGGGGGAGGGGGGLPPPPAGLQGGVLATFVSSGQTFRAWVTEPVTAQRIVDTWAGTAAPITSICAQTEPNAGAANHNAPWTWSLRAAFGINFTGLCVGCAWAWQTPAQAEAGTQAGPPYNCNDVNAGATWGMVRMVVTLAGVQDLR